MSATATESPTHVVGEPARARRSSGPLTALGGVGIAALVIAICTVPLIRGSDFILYDWFSHLWYIWHQEGALRAHHGLPSLFSHNQGGVFDPHYAFYGGTLYVISGAIALIVGHDAAYFATWILAFAMAYGGWFWLARQAGLGPWASHAPGILFVTSPWYLSSIYVVGNWAQTIAFSSLLLILAASVSILRADRLRPAPALALAAGTILYTGSHNLTLVWGTTVLALVVAGFLVFVPASRALLSRRGLLRLVTVVVPATLVNGWFLLPAIAYQSHTVIASEVETARQILRAGMDVVAADHLFALSRPLADPYLPHYSLVLPLPAVGWLVVGLVVLRPRRRSSWLRTALLLLGVMVATWILLTHVSLMLGLPHPYDMIQGPYRLEAYIQLALGGAVIALLVLAQRATPRGRLWAWAIVPVLVVSVLQARAQVQRQPASMTLKGPVMVATDYITNDTRPGAMDYMDARVPLYQPDRPFTYFQFSYADAERHDRAELTIAAQPGDIVLTNLKASPQLVHLSGAKVIARAPNGNSFVQVDRNATPGAARLVVTTAHPWPVRYGRLLTFLGLAGLAAIGVGLLLGRRRRR